MLKDRFSGNTGQTSPIIDGFAITPDDATEVQEVTRAIMVSTMGNVTCTLKGGSSVTLTSLVPGVIYPLRISQVWSTGTTASGIVGLV